METSIPIPKPTVQEACETKTKWSELAPEFPCRLQMNLSNYFAEDIERKWKGPFTFVLTADTQFGLIEKYIKKKPVPRWDEEIKLTTAAINCINRMRPKPRFLVVCGDMLDSLPKDDQGISLRAEQYEDFVKVFQALDPDIPLICACGNHDICDEPTEESFRIYKQQFGPDFFSFLVGGVKFCVVNSQYLKQPDNLPKEFEKQERFIKQMKDLEAKFLVVFQHIPFFVSEPEEEDVPYLNIEKEMRFKFMDVMNDAGVNYIFCGHYHRNGGGRYKNFDQIITTALGGPFGEDPSGFRLCQVTEQGIFHQYIPVILDIVRQPSLTVSQTILVANKSRLNFLKSLKGLNSNFSLNLTTSDQLQKTNRKENTLKEERDGESSSKKDENENYKAKLETPKTTSSSCSSCTGVVKKYSSSNIFSVSPSQTEVLEIKPADGRSKKQTHKFFFSRPFSIKKFLPN